MIVEPFTATITVGFQPLEVGVREITAGEVRAWLLELITAQDDREIDLADYLLFEDEAWRLADFARMTSLDAVEIEALRPSDLEAVLIKCKEVNPRFFSVLERLRMRGLAAMRAHDSRSLSTPARSWLAAFTRMFGAGRGRP